VPEAAVPALQCMACRACRSACKFKACALTVRTRILSLIPDVNVLKRHQVPAVVDLISICLECLP
jgi:hypothetical protein